ncbi:hypothetical protein HLPR_16390 [Helicovermis profundi]|uniref:Uncharacterized protein n=1 Tax=Helicovermis profundi TaxID=3065157 RepID=A0AAU9E7C2_9FIRM|nr:hypothetical protein HLPR_16390 [Clostridia bacterium S502]
MISSTIILMPLIPLIIYYIKFVVSEKKLLPNKFKRNIKDFILGYILAVIFLSVYTYIIK